MYHPPPHPRFSFPQDRGGRVVASKRTAVRPNSPVAAWPEERHDLAPAAAGGALVVRAWDRTTAWESVGSVARLDLGVRGCGGEESGGVGDP